jgi:predicted ribosome quality control (RQC) complex YloA/Tae2 family protein
LNDLEGGKGKIVSFLSKKTSLAPFYLEEACARAEINLDAKTEGLSEKQKERLLGSIKPLLGEKPSPSVFLEGGKPFAFSSLRLKKLAGEKKDFESFSKALESCYSNSEAPVLKGVKGGKLAFQLSSQEVALVEFGLKAEEAQNAGKWVFENAGFVDELLGCARTHDERALAKIVSKSGFNAKAEGSKIILEK